MSSHVVTLRNAIIEARAALTGATAVTDLVPERNITFGNSPQKDRKPRIVIEVSSAEYDATFTQSRKVQTFTVEYAVYSDSVDQCTAIMDEVRTALDTYQSSDFAVRVTDESFQAEVDNVLLGVVVATFQDAVGIPGFDTSSAETLIAVQEDLAEAQADLAQEQANSAAALAAETAAWEAATGTTLAELQNPFIGPLDALGLDDTPLAVSVRRLRGGYTGPCMRIRRISDQAHTDIGFDSNGDLDTAAIEAFCAGTLGVCQTWYDQSGARNHLSEADTSKQPVIYDSGAVITRNGKPALTDRRVASNISCNLSNTTFGIGDRYTSSGVFSLTNLTDEYVAFTTLGYNTSNNSYENNGWTFAVGDGLNNSSMNYDAVIFTNGVESHAYGVDPTRQELFDAFSAGPTAIGSRAVNAADDNGLRLGYQSHFRMLDTQELILVDNPSLTYFEVDDAFFAALHGNQMTYFGIS